MPFALMDVVLLLLGVSWILLWLRDVRTSGLLHAAAFAVGRAIVWGGMTFLMFLAAWGLNYRRVPLAAKLRTQGSPPPAIRVARLAVERVNTLYGASAATRAVSAPDTRLVEGLAAAASDLRLPMPVPGRPKSTLLNIYFERAGVDGMTDPFFLETLIARDLLPFERPFVIAHEWSHLAGIADEGDANFVGWLACLRGSPADQYSGWLFLFSELMPAISGSDRDALRTVLGAGPREDLRAIRDRLARHVNVRVSTAGWRVYDSYLKANRVEAGTGSYAGVVRLVLTTEFRGEWHPLLRP